MIQEILLTACGIAGVIIAALGLSTWRCQLRGQSDYDLVRRVLLASLRYRDAVRAARSPFSSYEPGEIDPDNRLTPKDLEFAALQSELNRRWKLILDARSELDTACLEVEALWGRDEIQVFRALRDVESSVHHAFLEAVDMHNPADPEKRSKEDRRRIRRTIYGAGMSDDDIGSLVDSSIAEISDRFRPRLRPPILEWAVVQPADAGDSASRRP